MKRIAIIIGITVFFGTSNICKAQMESVSYDHWFVEGNAAYNDENYEQALEFYKAIVETGMESASLYYNMGNTYYRMKDYPKSILYYEKALKLDPGNEDIRTNLEIANLAVVDKINEIPQSFVARKWNGLKTSFSADGWAWISVGAFAVLLFCLFLFLMSRRRGLRMVGFFVGLVMVLLLALSLLFAIQLRNGLTHKDKAIIMTPTVTVKSAPNNGVDLFVLHEGIKVTILDTEMLPVDDAKEVWHKIRIADGSVGWLQGGCMIAF